VGHSQKELALFFALLLNKMKLPAHWAGLPGKVILFYIVPLDPAYKAGLAGHVPVTPNRIINVY